MGIMRFLSCVIVFRFNSFSRRGGERLSPAQYNSVNVILAQSMSGFPPGAPFLLLKTLSVSSPSGAPLVKALPVNPADPAVTGPDIFAKLVPMAAHEASSLYRQVRRRRRRPGRPLCFASPRGGCLYGTWGITQERSHTKNVKGGAGRKNSQPFLVF